MKCPSSTAKYILKQLKQAGLVNFDYRKPIEITKFGKQVLVILRDCSSTLEQLPPKQQIGVKFPTAPSQPFCIGIQKLPKQLHDANCKSAGGKKKQRR